MPSIPEDAIRVSLTRSQLQILRGLQNQHPALAETARRALADLDDPRRAEWLRRTREALANDDVNIDDDAAVSFAEAYEEYQRGWIQTWTFCDFLEEDDEEEDV